MPNSGELDRIVRIGLIVADAPHLKTEQVALRLWAAGHKDVTVFTVPFQQRAPRQPLFQHRPDQSDAPHPARLCEGLGYAYRPCGGATDIPATGMDVFLMTGGILMPEAFLSAVSGPVLNAHAGLIPRSRGLDAFKWAILDQVPVGNTLHKIDAQVDMGELLETRVTPVFADDTLHRFAMRHYAAEIDMLVGFETALHSPEPRPDLTGPAGPARMRMKAEDEAKLDAAFVAYKAKFVPRRSKD